VDEEIAARMFEPFFTTKGHGLGLGLSVVRKIVSDHHGTVTIDKSPLGGAAVTINLPLCPNSLSAAQ